MGTSANIDLALGPGSLKCANVARSFFRFRVLGYAITAITLEKPGLFECRFSELRRICPLFQGVLV
jgi:hypothetical protein